MENIDNQPGKSSQGYQLTSQFATKVVYANGSERRLLLRAKVEVDSYQFQSSARVEVFTPTLTWTEVLAVHPSEWYGDMASYHDVHDAGEAYRALAGFVENLAKRSRTILGAAE